MFTSCSSSYKDTHTPTSTWPSAEALSHIRTLSLTLSGQGGHSKGWTSTREPWQLVRTSCASRGPVPGMSLGRVQAAGSVWLPLFPAPIYSFPEEMWETQQLARPDPEWGFQVSVAATGAADQGVRRALPPALSPGSPGPSEDC